MSFPLLEFHPLEYNGKCYRLLAHFGRTNPFYILYHFCYTDILEAQYQTAGQVRKLITIQIEGWVGVW